MIKHFISNDLYLRLIFYVQHIFTYMGTTIEKRANRCYELSHHDDECCDILDKKIFGIFEFVPFDL